MAITSTGYQAPATSRQGLKPSVYDKIILTYLFTSGNTLCAFKCYLLFIGLLLILFFKNLCYIYAINFLKIGKQWYIKQMPRGF